MGKIILFLCILSFSVPAFAVESCFIAQDNGRVLQIEGECNTRHNPGCDFSILLSLIGFDIGLLHNESSPVWSYKEGYAKYLNFWKKAHNPRTWIVDSCVWYSSNIVESIGFEKIKAYIHKFEYGNQDVSGMSREDWPGMLLISAKEQVEFLQKMLDRKLSVSQKACEMTEKITFIQDLPGDWKLHGKTGVGEGANGKSTGWFIGWIEKNNRRIPFASCVVHLQKEDMLPSWVARSNASNKLLWLINELEK